MPSDALADALEAAEAERDAALAVIEKARGMFHNDGFADSPLGRVLSSAPADVLRERDAEKWDEGHIGALHNLAFPHERTDNPYRKTKEEN